LPVLLLLPPLATRRLALGHVEARQPVLRLVLLGCHQAVIDHAKARAAATAKGDLEAVQEDAAGVGDLTKCSADGREVSLVWWADSAGPCSGVAAAA